MTDGRPEGLFAISMWSKRLDTRRTFFQPTTMRSVSAASSKPHALAHLMQIPSLSIWSGKAAEPALRMCVDGSSPRGMTHESPTLTRPSFATAFPNGSADHGRTHSPRTPPKIRAGEMLHTHAVLIPSLRLLRTGTTLRLENILRAHIILMRPVPRKVFRGLPNTLHASGTPSNGSAGRAA